MSWELKTLLGGFLPEGVINFLSARYFAEYPMHLSEIFSSSVKYGLCDTDKFCELLAQFILLYNFFFCIDEEFKMVRKLVFDPLPLKDFLLRLADNKVEKIDEFFHSNPLLNGSLVSFGYFENFPQTLVKHPFDLMAKCLFRGSATRLNLQHRGIDLMIPLVLTDGKISFIGIQVNFVKEEEKVSQVVKGALDRMRFSHLFKGQKSDRPFGLINLVLGECVFEVRNEIRTNQDPLEAPTVITFKGIPFLPLIARSLIKRAPNGVKGIPSHPGDAKEFLKLAPTDVSYLGINKEYLIKCDRIHDLSKEVDESQSGSVSERENPIHELGGLSVS